MRRLKSVSLTAIDPEKFHGLLALCRYPSYQQILGSVSGLLVKAEAFCAEKSINHD